MLWLDKHARFRKKLSPFIDRRLTPAETEQLAGHLASCDGCRAELERLRATVSALRDLPSANVPRSFALTPQMLQPRAARPEPSRPLTTTGMRLASGAVAIVLAVVLIGDLSGVGGNGDQVGGGDQEQAATAEFRAEGDETAEEALAPADMAADEGETGGAERDAAPSPATGQNATASCPTANAAGGAAAGAGAAGTPGLATSPSATPTPVDAEVLRACEEAAAAAAGAAETATPAVEDSPWIVDEGEQAEAAAASDGGADISTVRAAEIVLGVSLAALLGALVVESLLRRRRAV